MAWTPHYMQEAIEEFDEKIQMQEKKKPDS